MHEERRTENGCVRAETHGLAWVRSVWWGTSRSMSWSTGSRAAALPSTRYCPSGHLMGHLLCVGHGEKNGI